MKETAAERLDRQFIEAIPTSLAVELKRLRNSGAVDNTTALCTIYAVALRNIQTRYDNLQGSTARNLLRF